MSSPAVSRPSWRQELLGATHAAFVVVPLCLAYGLLAFAPMGSAWALQGVVGGFVAAIVAPLIGVALGLRSGLVFAPRPMSAIVLASFFAEFATLPEVRAGGPALIIVATLMYVAFVGAIEAIFGFARVGRLAKYLPAPVVAGFQCGAALVLLQTQWRTLLGVDRGTSAWDVLTLNAAINPVTLMLSVVCIGVAAVAMRKMPRWPVFALVLIAAAAVQWLAGHYGVRPSAPLGTFNLNAFDPSRVYFALHSLHFSQVEPLIPFIAGWALTGAVMSAAGALVGFKMIEEASHERFDVDRAMSRTGLANLVGAALGGLHSGAHVRATEVNLKQGASSWLSTLAAALLVLALALAFAPVISQVPKAAVAAILVVIAVSMFDPWTLQVLKQTLRERSRPTSDVASMLGTVAIVTGLAILTNLLIAMLGGVILAIISFIWRMSRSIIRRAYTLRDIQSRTIRSAEARARLLSKGSRVSVLELEGPLFFGTGEKLTDVLGRLSKSETDLAIVDMQRLTGIDSTAVRLLAQIDKRLERQDIALIFSGAQPHDRMYRLLEDFGMPMVTLHHGAYMARMFSDVDQALEWAEELVLHDTDTSLQMQERFALDTLDMLRGFSASELASIRKHLAARRYAEGDIVFRAGDSSREIFAIAEGRASVTLPPQTPGGAATRIVTFSAGAVFGEFALLDNQPRSATVRADTELECWVLSAIEFERLRSEEPGCAINSISH
jgi:sulfate permease, SulP family